MKHKYYYKDICSIFIKNTIHKIYELYYVIYNELNYLAYIYYKVRLFYYYKIILSKQNIL